MTCQGGGGHKGSTIWHFFSIQVKKYLGKASLIFSNRGGRAQKKSKLLTHMHSGHRERERKVGGGFWGLVRGFVSTFLLMKSLSMVDKKYWL